MALSTNKFYSGNCVDEMKNIPDSSIDLIVTSPPYDNLRDYKGYALDLHQIGTECFRVLKDGGACCMVMQDAILDGGRSCTTFRTIVDFVENVGFKLFESCIYRKHGVPGKFRRFRLDHEYVLIFFKGKRLASFDKTDLQVPAKWAGTRYQGTRRQKNGALSRKTGTVIKPLKCRGTVWDYAVSSTEGNRLKLQHPATFPDRLPEDLIRCFSKQGDVVLDPMCGSGTTCAMAYKNGRKFVGIDISPEYIDTIARPRLHTMGASSCFLSGFIRIKPWTDFTGETTPDYRPQEVLDLLTQLGYITPLQHEESILNGLLVPGSQNESSDYREN